jgi:hypothetical protein
MLFYYCAQRGEDSAAVLQGELTAADVSDAAE